MEKTKHFSNHRQKREQFIINTVGLGEDLDTFKEVNKKSGNTCLHIITTTGVYKIVDENNNTLITMWIARPQQLKDLYKRHHKQLPKWLLLKAIEHKQNYLPYIGECDPHYHQSTTKGFNSQLKPIRGKKNNRKKIVY